MPHLRILHAEDEPDVVKTVAALLTAHAGACGFTLDLSSVTSFGALRVAAFRDWDAILLDLSFPDSTTEETQAWLDENVAFLGAVLVITGSERDEVYDRSFDRGALRYILKPDFKNKHDVCIKPRHMLMDIWESVMIRRSITRHYGPPAR